MGVPNRYIPIGGSVNNRRDQSDDTMKTSIPSDVWEKKKALIARLYKDEEWPLKQVIKQIRTEDFNPRYVARAAYPAAELVFYVFMLIDR